MKSLIQHACVLLTVATLAALPARAADDSTTSTTTTNTAPKVKKHAAGFRGTILSVDPAAMTLTLKGRSSDTTVKVTSSTKIKKDKEPATFEDAAVGMRASGSGVKGEDGTWTAHTLNLTTMTKPASSAAAAPSSSTTSSDQK